MKSYDEALAWVQALAKEKQAEEAALRDLYAADGVLGAEADEQVARFSRSSFDVVVGAMSAIRFIYGEEGSRGVR